MKKQVLLLVCFLIILSGIGIVSAEYSFGNLSTSSGWSSFNYYYGDGNHGAGGGSDLKFRVINIQNSGGAKSFIHTDPVDHPLAWQVVNTNHSGWSKFNFTYNSQVVTEGTCGFQRLYDSAFPVPNEVGGYQYWTFDTWNITGLSGTVDLTWNDRSVEGGSYGWTKLSQNTMPYYASNPASNGTLYNPDGVVGYMAIYINGVGFQGGTDTFNIDAPFKNSYNATKPSGLGITGYVVKKEYPESPFTYNSRAYIIDGISNAPLTSEAAVSGDTFYFNVPAETIKICARTSTGIWFNSSRLFNGTNQTPVQVGFYNVSFRVKTKAGIDVYHAHVSFAPSQTDPVLTGYTNETGMISFQNVPGSAAAIVDVTASGFPEYIDTFTINADILKTITLASPTVYLYMDVKEAAAGYYIQDAEIGIKNVTSGVWRNSTHETGAVYFDSTGTNYEYPLAVNQTVVVAASKAGFRSAYQTVTVPYDRYTVTLNLANINGTAPSSGNFTAVIGTTDMQDGKPITGGSLTIQELGRIASTNQGGVATFKNIAVGTYTVQASASGYESASTSITGTDQEVVMKNIRLMRTGCSLSGQGELTCNGTIVHPGVTGAAGNQTPNEKAAGGVTAFLNNIVSVGLIVFILIGVWFVKKIFW